MAYWPMRIHLNQDCIGVAIRVHADNALGIAAGRALMPVLAATARIEPELAGRQRAPQSFPVDEPDHQHLARGVMLHRSRQQPLREIECRNVRLLADLHGVSARSNRRTSSA